MKTIILLRHAECEGVGYIGRGSNPPLSQEGRERAGELIAPLLTFAPKQIFSSPLLRCRQTIDPFWTAKKGEGGCAMVSWDKRLEELDFGRWEGCRSKTVKAHDPDLFDRWLTDPSFPAPGGESLAMLQERVEAFWRQEIAGAEAERILILTHGGPIRCLLSLLVGRGTDGHWLFSVDRGNFCTIKIFDDGNYLIDGVNLH
ncbi:histidine phosphatase family protein [Sediminispirochaeta bajacaliforniensis]|uniref:histidine phosphatase family protein n=1 Tax=Sediminispirochaeta bajacaliforniensis TaxID=148 RepID=UPI00035D4CEF|nr:histidine phosphatase family protein [Sediminispirochaeta bajacaliforniensis]